MRTVLICHHDDPISKEGLAGWLDSFSDLVGIVVIRETSGRLTRRVRREIRRVGALRFVDVLAFRAYYRLFLRAKDAQWERECLAKLIEAHSKPRQAKVLETSSPNSDKVAVFLRDLAPDLMIARCKSLLKRRIFGVPKAGTFVMHPGICPQYRNAHGCFWALARRDRDNVGITLLKIDEGIDTGPVYGYFRYRPDEVHESHIVIQQRAVVDNLDPLRERLLEIAAGVAKPLSISDHDSREWGQPWLSSYLSWKLRARRER
jgi:hypothetical protein